jgi:uncharacterized Zn-finger protein
MNEKQACADRQYEVSGKDLPLSCPTNEMRLWDAHPKVYLAIEKTGRAQCSYCGARFTLKTDEKSA